MKNCREIVSALIKKNHSRGTSYKKLSVQLKLNKRAKRLKNVRLKDKPILARDVCKYGHKLTEKTSHFNIDKKGYIIQRCGVCHNNKIKLRYRNDKEFRERAKAYQTEYNRIKKLNGTSAQEQADSS